jgi:hypothetical protein
MTARLPDVIGGLSVEQHWTGHFWDVKHAGSGLNAAGYLRQRRFAEQARGELLALGIDWTADKRAVAAELRAPRALVVHDRWDRRVRTPGNDPTTHEWYSAHVTVGTARPNSAARAAELRAADRRDVVSDPGGLSAWGADGGN